MDDQLAINEADISFEILFHQNPHPMWIVDVDTLRFLLVNEAAIKHYGYTYQEFLQITLKDIRPKDEHADMKAMVKRIKHNETVTKNLTHIKKNGTCIYVQITSYRVMFHQKACRMVLINDITEQRVKDQKINDAWVRIYQTLESITDGFITIDPKWRITYWNKEAESTFSIPKETAVGKLFWKICPHGKGHELFQRLKEVMHTGDKSTFEIYLDRYDKWLCITAYPGANGLTIYFQDITGQKRDAEQIQLKNKHLDEIAYINSHIIRKPIANIMGIVNSLEDDLIGYEYFENALKMLKASAEELDRTLMVINNRVEQVNTVLPASRKKHLSQ
ncbi:PAS domain-containing protein [Mucilaginibacter agri]|uniref:histidine kinase n=1 Tax=Mucilaginibacter agri TaxID=2695265 RepID=A0A965ZH76_9SPHI|nr:PAS domain-containing protein [Mucilaginibacter agri]NCD69676.1 PAS domain-containing protein [Mucilaginibacter agri]